MARPWRLTDDGRARATGPHRNISDATRRRRVSTLEGTDSTPRVGAVSVVGRPDPEWGEAVVAFVVPAAGETAPAAAEPDATDVAALADALVARYAQYRDRPFAELIVLRIVAIGGWAADTDP